MALTVKETDRDCSLLIRYMGVGTPQTDLILTQALADAKQDLILAHDMMVANP